MKLPNLGAPANLTNPRVSAIIAPRLEEPPRESRPGGQVTPHSTFGKCDVTLRVAQDAGYFDLAPPIPPDLLSCSPAIHGWNQTRPQMAHAECDVRNSGESGTMRWNAATTCPP